jgi:L-histidine N-alpha-methyltransferase
MSAVFHVLEEEQRERILSPEEQFARDVQEGLARRHKRLPSKYLYDDRGSRLFQQITELDEYYLTRCEREIFATHAADISRLAGNAEFNLVELGVGDGHKTELLLRRFLKDGKQFRYVPIDISGAAMGQLTEKLEKVYPSLAVKGIVGDYFNGLTWNAMQGARRNFVLFLGSNIGNLGPWQTREFLNHLRGQLKNGDLALIGFDLKKDVDVLLAAYNDSEGITAEFNLNLLRRINRELDADFDLNRFRHYEIYSPHRGAMESYLLSLDAQTVSISALEKEFGFLPYEAIQTEYSFKYDGNGIAQLAADAGFVVETEFRDSRNYFSDSVWRAA